MWTFKTFVNDCKKMATSAVAMTYVAQAMWIVTATTFAVQFIHSHYKDVAAANQGFEALVIVMLLWLFRRGNRYIQGYFGAIKALLNLMLTVQYGDKEAIVKAVEDAQKFFDSQMDSKKPPPKGEKLH